MDDRDQILGRIRNIPFTAYDIFGYLMPGFAFILGILCFEYSFNKTIISNNPDLLEKIYLPIYKAFSLFQPAFDTNGKAIFSYLTFLLITLLSASYFIGHIISAFSSLLIDRTFVYKAYGYPFERFILGAKKDTYNKLYYMSTFFYINSGLLTCYMYCVHQITILKYLCWIATLILLIQLIFRYFLRCCKLDDDITNKGVFLLMKKFTRFVVSPYQLLATQVDRNLGTEKGLSGEFIQKYNYLFRKRFQLCPEKEESNNFWLCYNWVAIHAPSLNILTSNWLQLYSFARNLATSLYFVFIYCFILVAISFKEFTIETLNESIIIEYFPLVILIFAFLMLLRYYYLYVCYFTKFIIRSFVTLEDQSTQ